MTTTRDHIRPAHTESTLAEVHRIFQSIGLACGERCPICDTEEAHRAK